MIFRVSNEISQSDGDVLSLKQYGVNQELTGASKAAPNEADTTGSDDKLFIEMLKVNCVNGISVRSMNLCSRIDFSSTIDSPI